MYVSRLFLNPMSRQVRIDLNNRYDLHRTLMRAFDGIEEKSPRARKQFDILYRLEVEQENRLLKVTVQSQTEPNWQKIAERYPDYFADPILLELKHQVKPYETKNIDHVINAIKKGEKYKFFLEVNPTKKVLPENIEKYKPSFKIKMKQQQEGTTQTENSTEKNQESPMTNMEGQDEKHHKKRVRLSLMDAQDQIAWLKEKATKHGFKIEQIITIDDKLKTIKGKKMNQKTNKQEEIIVKSIRVIGILQVEDETVFKNTIIEGIGKGKAFGCGLLSIAKI